MKPSTFCFMVSVSLRTSGLSMSFFNAIMARRGMVNSAMTSIDATVRNLAYIGT